MTQSTGSLLSNLQPIGNGVPGWRITRRGECWVDVISGANQTRIVLQGVDDPPRSYTQFWCYFGATRDVAAVLAAMAWVQTGEEEPVGWARSYRVGRREEDQTGS